MLSRGEIFFASADELNDGSECRPRYVLKGSAELWDRLAEMILIDACCESNVVPATSIRNVRSCASPLGIALRQSAGAGDLDFDMLGSLIREQLPPLLGDVKLGVSIDVFMGLVERAFRRARRRLNEHLYIASFSRNPRDPTMWGHYGNAERGFCIVFRAPERRLRIQSSFPALHGCRPSDKPGVMELGIYREGEVELKSVSYRSAPLRFNAFHQLIPHFSYSEEEHHYDVPLLLPGEAPSRHEDRLGLVKASTWKYEQEVRAFLPSWGELTPEARCVRYHSSAVAGVIFGPKMSEADKKRAIVCCYVLQEARREAETRTGPFVFLQAQQCVDSFQMALRAVGVLGGIYASSLFPFESLQRVNDAVATAACDIVAEIQREIGTPNP
jgi:hypothetical protein